jgi:hypothetical protein
MPCTHASRSLFLQQVVGVDIICSLVDCFAPGSIDIRKLLPHLSVNAKIQSRLGDHLHLSSHIYGPIARTLTSRERLVRGR